MSRKIMQHVFTLIVLLSLGSAVFLGYKLVQKERDYQKGQESLERVYQVMEEFSRTAVLRQEVFRRRRKRLKLGS